MNEAKTAKLFRTGGSQAVRLPKEFRFEGDRVRIRRHGDGVLIEPLAAQDFDAWLRRVHALIEPGFMADGRQQPPMPKDRKMFD
jgi:antitoxin VapB